MMKSIVFCDMDMRYLPPYHALMKTLDELGEDPVFIGNDFWKNREILESLGIRHHLVRLPDFGISFASHPMRRLRQKFFPSAYHNKIRRCYWDAIRSVEGGDTDVVLWTLNTCSMLALGDECLRFGRRHVHFCYELEDDLCNHGEFFDGKRFIDETTFVQCEENRADIMAGLYNLKKTPFVIPNCPVGLPRTRNMPVQDPAVAKIVLGWKDKFVFLYQGILSRDRMGLVQVLQWLCEAFPNDIIALQTHVKGFEFSELLAYKNFQVVPALAAPQHLEVTSHASVGIAFYTGANQVYPYGAIFCAPNKIYEYAAFGVPTLGNDIAGLRYTVMAAGAGEGFHDVSQRDVVAAAEKIKGDYATYQQRALKFYDDVDMRRRVKAVVDYARGGGR